MGFELCLIIVENIQGFINVNFFDYLKVLNQKHLTEVLCAYDYI